jgi:alpha-L-rhamnosidase
VRPAVWNRLEQEILIRRDGHIYAGITGGAFLYEMLLASDRQDLLFAMANKDTYPGWGDMLRRGLTTMGESWDLNNSWCHSSYLYIWTWFIEGLAGIKPDPNTPGFKRFVVKPGVVDDPSLKWVKAHHDCIYGRIVSNWSIDDKRMLTLIVTVPPNTTATLFLPTADAKTATESGRPWSQAFGVRRTAAERRSLTLELQPGRYEFKSQLWN